MNLIEKQFPRRWDRARKAGRGSEHRCRRDRVWDYAAASGRLQGDGVANDPRAARVPRRELEVERNMIERRTAIVTYLSREMEPCGPARRCSADLATRGPIPAQSAGGGSRDGRADAARARPRVRALRRRQ